jgi:hypothetical protein
MFVNFKSLTYCIQSLIQSSVNVRHNDVLQTLIATQAVRGGGGHTETVFSVVSKHLALECKRELAFIVNELANLRNDEFFASIFD